MLALWQGVIGGALAPVEHGSKTPYSSVAARLGPAQEPSCQGRWPQGGGLGGVTCQRLDLGRQQ